MSAGIQPEAGAEVGVGAGAGATDGVGAGTAVGVGDPASAALLQTLQTWSEQGWIRRLDHALARLLAELDPQVSPTVLLACALVAQLEGRGHTCLPLSHLLRDPANLLGWAPQASAALQAELARLPASAWGWQVALRACPLVALDDNSAPDLATRAAAPPGPASGQSPLVLRGQLLYLRRYWGYERRVGAQVLERVSSRLGTPPDSSVDLWVNSSAAQQAVPDADLARGWLDRLFPAAPAPQAAAQAGAEPYLDWQKIACAVALRGRLSVITGGPGTGKTYTAARLLALLLAVSPTPERLRVALAAPTGKAAARLRQAIDTALAGLQQQLGDSLPLAALASHIGPARTLHGLLGARPDSRRFQANAAQPLAVDVLIVDEASMVHLEMMAALLEALPPGARLVLLGDKDQLASVEAGAVLGDLCRDAERGQYRPDTAAFIAAATGQTLPPARLGAGSALAQQTVMLRQSRRFGGPIGQLALAVNAGDSGKAAALLRAGAGAAGAAGVAGVAGVTGVAGATAAEGAAGAAQAAVSAPDGASAGAPQSAVPLQALFASSPAVLLQLALHGREGAVGGYRTYLDTLRQGPAPAGGALAVRADTDINAAAPTSATSATPAVTPPTPDPTPAAWTAWVLRVLADFERFRLLCALREGEWGCEGLNRAVERALVAEGLLVKRGEWYEGRPVMVTRNDPGLGVFNGDIGIVLRSRSAGSALRAWFADGPALRSVAVSRLAAVETAFAMTVHKAQGSEFEHTVLVLPQAPSRGLTRELVYTGITRARLAFTLVSGRREALADALARRTQRASGLLDLLGDSGGAADAQASQTAAASPRPVSDPGADRHAEPCREPDPVPDPNPTA